MINQLDTDREYLNHVLRNSTVRIEGCLREIETTLLEMAAAVRTFREGMEEEQLAQITISSSMKLCRQDAKKEEL